MRINKDIINAYIRKYGRENQSIVCVEELSELTKEITKMLRDKGNLSYLAEEMADVYICLKQIGIIYNVSDLEVQAAIDAKEERNRRRFNDENR